MAKFGFSQTGPRRLPTEDERANGFPCGAADQTLFNGLHNRVEAELADLISYAGLVGTDTDMTQVRNAVLALIAAATGGGEAEDYLLLSQARLRLPIFPDMQTGDGSVNITSPANGVVRIPGGLTFLHRGIFPVTTVQTDFNTVSSRTYHLRWNPTDGLVMKWVGDVTYNPGGVAETDVFFDTSYDNMLIGRVITNAGNVPTITSLANKSQLAIESLVLGTNGQLVSANGARWDFVKTYNWSRRPTTFSIAVARNSTGPGTPDDHDFNISALGTNPEVTGTSFGVDRYRWANTIMRDGSQDLDMHFSARA